MNEIKSIVQIHILYQVHHNAELELVAQLLSKDKEISMAIVFGSISKGFSKPDSDIDIAIKTSSPLKTQHKKALIESLATLLGRVS